MSLCSKDHYFIAEHLSNAEDSEEVPKEEVVSISQDSEAGFDASWLKGNVPLSITEGKCETVHTESCPDPVTADTSVAADNTDDLKPNAVGQCHISHYLVTR